jgi:glycerol-1-phosphatase
LATTSSCRGDALQECSSPPTEVYDTALFDLDGVVYVGGEPLADAPRQVARAVEAGVTAAFVTNNASSPPADVAARLRRIGVPCRSGDVVTSAQAAARLLARRLPRGSRVLVVGGDGLRAALTEHGLVPVSRYDDGPAAVVQGFHPDVGWRLLAEGAAAVSAGLPWVASNTDQTLPGARGRLPGNGLLVDVVARTTGRRPEVAGKPEPPLFEETLLRVGGERPLVVGDRLDTDIEGAVRCDVDSLLVMSGVTDAVTLATAPPGRRPSYLAAGLDGLFTPHPLPSPVPQGYACGGWTAQAVSDGPDTRLELTGRGPPVDALRALASLCWARQDAGQAWGPEAIETAWRAAGEVGRPLPWGP